MSVPLGYYRNQADIRLHCLSCAYGTTYPLDLVIARLQARGIDAEGLGIRDLARHIRHDCPRCGAHKWEALPAFHRIPGAMGRA
jgi:hypothetical protein